MIVEFLLIWITSVLSVIALALPAYLKVRASYDKLYRESENYRSLAEHYAGEADRLANDGSRKFLTECEKAVEEIER